VPQRDAESSQCDPDRDGGEAADGVRQRREDEPQHAGLTDLPQVTPNRPRTAIAMVR